MKFVGFEREEEAEAWAREVLALDSAPSFFRTLSCVDKSGDFVCVVVLTNFSFRNVDINIAAKRKDWATPKEFMVFYNSVFSYLFKQLKLARVTALIRGKNTVCLKFSKRLGFKPEGVMRNAFADDDLHIYGMLAEDYQSSSWCRG